MRYTLIQLRKRDEHWTLEVSPDDSDREATATKPDPMGFYHAPRKHSLPRAFRALRDTLIDHRRQAIERLQQEIAELESIDLPPGTPPRPPTRIFHQYKRPA